jgi:hypothetical protein
MPKGENPIHIERPKPTAAINALAERKRIDIGYRTAAKLDLPFRSNVADLDSFLVLQP